MKKKKDIRALTKDIVKVIEIGSTNSLVKK
jgi:hypothetical protein